ncbi:MAG: Fic family protein, partial [Blastocatellia bacterium]|nr:Fic family protein [Blastocatellia bacterium]
MPKQFSEPELDAIVEAVRRFPDGARLSDLAGLLPKKLPYRSFQRRLASLVSQKRLLLEGWGRGSRYRLPQSGKIAAPVEVPPTA